MQFNEVDIAVVALLVLIAFILLVILGQLNKKFAALGAKSAEQERAAQMLQEDFQKMRSALLDAQTNMQTKVEQRFGEVQQGLEKRLGEMSHASVDRLAKSNEEMQ